MLSYPSAFCELLRQWCGHCAITFQERLITAEAEARPLDMLVAELITALERAGEVTMADHFHTQHERDGITPERARPMVERPLDPSEDPVGEIGTAPGRSYGPSSSGCKIFGSARRVW